MKNINNLPIIRRNKASDPDTLAASLADIATQGLLVESFKIQVPETDDTGRIQRAVNAVQSANRGKLIFSDKTYTISSPIILSTASFTIEGMDRFQTTIKALASMDVMFKFADTSENNRFTFESLTLDGNGLANYGIYSTKIAHGIFSRLRVTNTLIAGVSTGYGWSNDFLECEFVNNTGDGIVTNTNNNNIINIVNTKIFNNSGFGIKGYTSSTYTFNVRGCTIEKNAKGGIYIIGGAKVLNIKDNYFEANGDTGYTFSNPALTIKADVIINGSSDPTIFSNTTPTETISIMGNSHQFYVSSNIAYMLIGVTNGTIENNENISGNCNLIGLYGDVSLSNVNNIRVENNKGFIAKYTVVNGILQYNAMNFSTFIDSQSDLRNYAKQSLYDYSNVLVVSGGSWYKGNLLYQGFPSIELANVIGNSDIYGFTIDLSVNLELRDQIVYFGAWVYVTGNTMNARLYANGQYDSQPTDNILYFTWKWKEFQIAMPHSGTVTFGFQACNNESTVKNMYIAKPILALAGANKEKLFPRIESPVYKASAVPTSGTWNTGEMVYNSSPTASGNIGWVCVAGGAPGTWKTFGTIGA